MTGKYLDFSGPRELMPLGGDPFPDFMDYEPDLTEQIRYECDDKVNDIIKSLPIAAESDVEVRGQGNSPQGLGQIVSGRPDISPLKICQKTNINNRIFLFMMRFEPTIINSFSVSIHIQFVKVIKVYRTDGLGQITESPQNVDDIRNHSNNSTIC